MSEAGELEKALDQTIIIAMKAREAERLTTLRLIKNGLKNKAIEKSAALTTQESAQTLATMIKQRRDSIEQFTNGNRPSSQRKRPPGSSGSKSFSPSLILEIHILWLFECKLLYINFLCCCKKLCASASRYIENYRKSFSALSSQNYKNNTAMPQSLPR